jgi:hypothetical protein
MSKDPSFAEPEVKSSVRPKHLVPDYSRQAKQYLESHIAMAFGAPAAPEQTVIPDHATAEQVRVAATLEAQRNQGNEYVQRALESYEARTKGPQRKTAAKEPAEVQEKKEEANSLPTKADEPKAAQAISPTAQASGEGKQSPGKANQAPGEEPAVKTAAQVATPDAKEVPGPKTKGAAKANAPAAGGGGGGHDPVAAWQSKAHNSVAAIKPGHIKGPGGSTLKAAGAQSAAKQAEKTKGVPADAKQAVTPPKQLQGLPPVPDDLSKEAIALLDKKRGCPLDPQPLPDLAEKSPGGHIPIIGKAMPPSVAVERAMAAKKAQEAADAKKDEQPKKDDKKDAKKDKKQEQKEKPQTEADKEAEKKKLLRTGEVVKDEEPPPAVDVPEAPKVDIGAVVASLILEERKYANQIVDEAKKEAFRGAFDTVKSSFGFKFEDEEVVKVNTELQRLAEAAGVAKDELQKKIEDRRRDLYLQDKDVKDTESADATAARKTEEDAEKQFAQSVDDIRLDLERSATDRQNAMVGEADAEKIRQNRDRLIASVNEKFGNGKVDYETTRKRIKDAVDAAAGRQVRAYEVAAQEDQNDLQRDADTEEKRQAARGAYRPTKYWLDDQEAAIQKAVEIRKLAIDDQVDGYEKDLSEAADAAREKIRDFAAKQLGYERGFFQRLFEWISDWVHRSKIECDAWARKRTAENKAAVEKDAAFLDTELAKLVKMTEEEQLRELATLDHEQAVVFGAFLTSKGKDRIGAVAAGLIFRISNQQRPELVKRLEKEVIDCPFFDQVNAVAEARNERFKDQAKIKTFALHKAFAGWGTDEAGVFKALEGLSPIETHAIELFYSQTYDESLRDRLKSELDDWATFTSHDIDRANALMEGDQATAVAVELNQAMHGTTLGLGLTTDSDTIFEALRKKSPTEIAAIKKAYREKYGKDLQFELDDQLNHWYRAGTHERDRGRALMKGDTDTSDAIGLDQAMHGGLLGLGIGTNRGDIEAIYEKRTAELKEQASARGWTTDKLNAELKKSSAALDDKYGGLYADNFKDRKAGQSVLSAAYEDEMKGADLRLITGLRENDLAKVSAAKISIEHNSYFYADDKKINKALNEQYTSALEDSSRNRNLVVDEAIEADRDVARASGDWEGFYKKWTPEEKRRKHKEADAKAEEDAKDKGEKNFDRMEKEYTQYTGKVSSGFLSPNVGGGLRADVLGDTQLTQNKKAQTLLDQKGRLTDIQQMRYAIQGAGTDEDDANASIKGKNKEEMEDFKLRWLNDPENKKAGITEPLDTFVLDDYSGREYADMKANLDFGESPDDPKEQLAKAEQLQKYEHKGSIAHSVFGFGEEDLKAIDSEVVGLQEKVGKLDDLKQNHANDKDFWTRYSQMKGDIDSQSSVVQAAIDSHRKSVDALADTVTQVIGIVVTAAIIIGSIILDVVTVGGAAAATPAEGAAIGAIWTALGISLIGTGLSMTAKYVIKGSAAYGWEEVGQDVAIGLVDAIVNAATAGTAGRLLKGGSKILMNLAEKSALGKVVANFLAHAAEGAIQATPGALLGGALNKANYKEGNAILNILEGAAVQVAGSAVMAGGVGAFHGAIKDNILIRARTDPEFQTRVWEKFQSKNPNKTKADFLAQLDHLISTETTHGFNDPKLQEDMRVRVLEHVSPELKGALKEVRIRVLPEDEFKALTRSDSGNAVTVFIDGKPTVIVKAGTDLGQLGEEGIHLAQANEPATAAKVGTLDETNLQHWDEMDLDTQMDLYETKLELEIDAHERLAHALESQKAGSKNPEALADKIERNNATLENLRNRQIEVNGITTEEKLNIEAGLEPKPQYLDQPARLFAKDSTIPAEALPAEASELRPIREVRDEYQALKEAESKSPLNEEQQARIKTLETELQSHYLPKEGETLPQMEKRLLAQQPGETLDQYRERLGKLSGEVARGGNVQLSERYQELLEEVPQSATEFADLETQKAEVDKQLSAIDQEFRHPKDPFKRMSKTKYNNLASDLQSRAKVLLDKIKSLGNRYLVEPWKSISLNDPVTTRVGLRGELEMTTGIQENAGATAMGKTVRPERIATAADLEAAHEAYKGQTGIDGVYSRPNPKNTAKKQFLAGESKATGEGNTVAPTGKGELQTTKGGLDQLSTDWIRGNLAKSGLSETELKEFRAALERGEVVKVYAQTSPKGTKYYRVIDVSSTQVELGAEITNWNDL